MASGPPPPPPAHKQLELGRLSLFNGTCTPALATNRVACSRSLPLPCCHTTHTHFGRGPALPPHPHPRHQQELCEHAGVAAALSTVQVSQIVQLVDGPLPKELLVGRPHATQAAQVGAGRRSGGATRPGAAAATAAAATAARGGAAAGGAAGGEDVIAGGGAGAGEPLVVLAPRLALRHCLQQWRVRARRRGRRASCAAAGGPDGHAAHAELRLSPGRTDGQHSGVEAERYLGRRCSGGGAADACRCGDLVDAAVRPGARGPVHVCCCFCCLRNDTAKGQEVEKRADMWERSGAPSSVDILHHVQGRQLGRQRSHPRLIAAP